MNNIREMEILKTTKKEIPEMKTTVTEMKNAFDGHFSRLDPVRKESLSLRIYQ